MFEEKPQQRKGVLRNTRPFLIDKYSGTRDIDLSRSHVHCLCNSAQSGSSTSCTPMYSTHGRKYLEEVLSVIYAVDG